MHKFNLVKENWITTTFRLKSGCLAFSSTFSRYFHSWILQYFMYNIFVGVGGGEDYLIFGLLYDNIFRYDCIYYMTLFSREAISCCSLPSFFMVETVETSKHLQGFIDITLTISVILQLIASKGNFLFCFRQFSTP